MRLDIKIIRQTTKGVGRRRQVRRSETTTSMGLTRTPTLEELRKVWEFETTVNAMSDARLHLNLVEDDDQGDDL